MRKSDFLVPLRAIRSWASEGWTSRGRYRTALPWCGVAVDDGLAASVFVDAAGAVVDEATEPVESESSAAQALSDLSRRIGIPIRRAAGALPDGSAVLLAHPFPTHLSASECQKNAYYQVPAGPLRELDRKALHLVVRLGKPASLIAACPTDLLDAQSTVLRDLGAKREQALYHRCDVWAFALPTADAVVSVTRKAVSCAVQSDEPAYHVWDRTDALDWPDLVAEYIRDLRGRQVSDARRVAVIGAAQDDRERFERIAGVDALRASFGDRGDLPSAWWLAYGAARAAMVAA